MNGHIGFDQRVDLTGCSFSGSGPKHMPMESTGKGKFLQIISHLEDLVAQVTPEPEVGCVFTNSQIISFPLLCLVSPWTHVNLY